MEDKNKKVITTKKLIITNQPKVDNNQNKDELNQGVSSTLEEHLRENISTTQKKGVKWKDVLTYFLMVVIVGLCLVLIYFFLDKNGMNPLNPTTTTTTVDVNLVKTSTKPPTTLIYDTTKPPATAATHLVFPTESSGSGDSSSSGPKWSKPQKTPTTTQDTGTNDVNIRCPGTTYNICLKILNVKNNTVFKSPEYSFVPGDYYYEKNGQSYLILTIPEGSETVRGVLSCKMKINEVTNCSVIPSTTTTASP